MTCICSSAAVLALEMLALAVLLLLIACSSDAPHPGTAAAAAPSSPCPAWQTLSNATIVVDAGAPEYEKFAAVELAGQLAALTQLAAPVIIQCDLSAGAGRWATAADSAAATACGRLSGRNGTIAVGTAAAGQLFGVATGDLSAAMLGPEGLVATSNRTNWLRAAPHGSFALAGTQMQVGPVNSSHGTLFAVYHLLHVLGVRFFAQDAIVYRQACPSMLPALDITYRPQMEQRNVYTWAMGTFGLHAMRSHQNMGGSKWPAGYSAASYGVSVEVATPPGSVHTSYTILGSNITNARVPPKDLWEKNPEWFWPRNGGYGQLCWTNQSLLDFVAAQAIGYLRAQPHANVLDLSQNDNGNYCNDTHEQTVIAEEGSAIGPLLRAVNFVAEAVRNALPDRMITITTLAYEYGRTALRVTKPLSNVAVKVTANGVNYGVPLTETRNSAFVGDLAAWGRITSRLYIWDYIDDAGNHVQPWPNHYTVGPNVKFFAQHGVRGVFEEGASVTAGDGADMAELKNYVLAEMLWNPDQDPNALIEEFVNGYYGVHGAVYVRAHLDNMHRSVQSSGCNATENSYADGCLNSCCDYPPAGARDKLETYLNAEALIASAQVLQRGMSATNGTAPYQHRVSKVYFSVLYSILYNWDAVVHAAAASGIAWRTFVPEQTLAGAFELFAGIYRRTNVRTIDGQQNHKHCLFACPLAQMRDQLGLTASAF